MHDHWICADGILAHAVTWDPPAHPFGVAPGPIRARGDAKQPDPLLLLHGLGANTITWEPVAGALAERTGASVTAIDLPGFGRTPIRECGGTVGRGGRLVISLLEETGPAVLVGNSMGGAISVGVAARRPDLVRGLVLVDPAVPRVGSWRDTWVVTMRFSPLLVDWMGRLVITARTRTLGPQALVDANLDWSVSDRNRVDPEIRRRLIALASERHGQRDTVMAYSHAARSLIRYLWHHMPADLAAIECPTLIVHGALDRLVPLSSIKALAEKRPDFTLEVLDDVAHAPQLEAPDRFLDVVVPWLTAPPDASAFQDGASITSGDAKTITPAAG
jgi:pimeloyl-ACP methyl ester carboxylesterase